MINKYSLTILLIILSFINIKSIEDNKLDYRTIIDSVLILNSSYTLDKNSTYLNCINDNLYNKNDIEYCYSYEFQKNISIIDYVISSETNTSATVSVIKHKNKIRYLTSDHVCEELIKDKMKTEFVYKSDAFINESKYIQFNYKNSLMNVEGKKTNFISIIKRDKNNDLCEITTQKNINKGIEIINEDINISSEVYNISSPLGFMEQNKTYIDKGFYLGKKDKVYLFNITIYQGSSGSPIIYKNKILSIVFAFNKKMKNISHGSSKNAILEFISNKH